MKHGFIKVATATPVLRVADCEFNASQIIDAMKKCEENKVKILVFPSLSLTGSTCADLFFQEKLLCDAEASLKKIVTESKNTDCLTVAGLPLNIDSRLYNCAVFFCRGEILGIVPKINISKEESKYFSKGNEQIKEVSLFGKSYPFGSRLIFVCNNKKSLAVSSCIGDDLFSFNPISSCHALSGATIIVNPSSSMELIGKQERISLMVKCTSMRLKCGYIYAESGVGESTQDGVFASYNAIAENGKILNEGIIEDSGLVVSEIDTDSIFGSRAKDADFEIKEDGYKKVYFSLNEEKTLLTRKIRQNPFIPDDGKEAEARCEKAFYIQTLALSRRLMHTNSKKAVIGVSGGLDSCLALLALCRTMKALSRPMTDILAISMPCFGTSVRTKSNAQKLSECLGTDFRTIDIKESVLKHFEDIGHSEEEKNVVYENAQARERTQVLMDMANLYGGIVIGTGDLSELALGFATYNGDHMSMYGVNASVPKTLVKRMVKYEADNTDNEELKNILYDIILTPVSPELLPTSEGNIEQKTEDIVGPYELHDFFLYYVLKHGFAPSKILRLSLYAFFEKYDKETIKYWLKKFYTRFFAQQFKRSCLPEGPSVGRISLSPRTGFLMPSDSSVRAFIEEIDLY